MSFNGTCIHLFSKIINEDTEDIAAINVTYPGRDSSSIRDARGDLLWMCLKT